MDLYDDFIQSSHDVPQPAEFTPPTGATELTAFDEYGPDYYSVWFLNGKVVAIEAPMENFFRVAADLM
ncbi:hypothetical protein AZH90_004284 [Salmonella enterica subsp. enterica serovar Legon]|nr:hypothetical protein [Salmonella enterica subsp. enterica serovar Legon]EDW9825355.1 hypothetical protein [Salmonella enterica]EDZ3589404.1 hypothetical protein [Salmonella enterica subsp. enterica serovar Wagenia]EHL5833699.1 hypothetical protein [Salmonella enterica]